VNHKTRLFVFLGLWATLGATATRSQDGGTPPAPQQSQGRRWESQEDGPKPLLGKITAVRDSALEITAPDGTVVTVKLTAQTELRQDRQPAKATDFKVGDMVVVRGDENPDHTLTAKMVGARTEGMMGRGPSGGRGGMMMMGTLGKDYVIGEVKAIHPPKLTVLRPDNVMQVLELNEETSLRRERESITMAEIQVGDHLMARGTLQNDVFVPKGVMVMNAEQWKHLQEFTAQGNATKAAEPDTKAPKPQE
jgi:hypothetical protein